MDEDRIYVFGLYRLEDKDPDKVSGTGLVAVGVFHLEWYGDYPYTLFWTKENTKAEYQSLEQISRIHGHHGSTLIIPLGLIKEPQ